MRPCFWQPSHSRSSRLEEALCRRHPVETFAGRRSLAKRSPILGATTAAFVANRSTLPRHIYNGATGFPVGACATQGFPVRGGDGSRGHDVRTRKDDVDRLRSASADDWWGVTKARVTRRARLIAMKW